MSKPLTSGERQERKGTEEHWEEVGRKWEGREGREERGMSSTAEQISKVGVRVTTFRKRALI